MIRPPVRWLDLARQRPRSMLVIVAVLVVPAFVVAALGSKTAPPVDRHRAADPGTSRPSATHGAHEPAANPPAPRPAPTPEATTPGVQAKCRYLAYPDGVITPDPACTPGVVDPAAAADPRHTICAPRFGKRVRPLASYTEPLKISEMVAYASVGPPSAYEEDHLVAIEDGGSPRDPRNLWPEYRYRPGGALDKNRAEAKVHQLICAGLLTVRQGARILDGDWKQVLRP